MVAMTGVVDDVRVLLAGAGGGIGRSVALAFAREGAQLVLTGRTRASLEETREACPCPERVIVEPADISCPEDVERVFARAETSLGGVDVLVNAAGVHGAIGPAHECDPAGWLAALQVNLYGSFLLCRSVTPGMLARERGRILLFAGGGATSPRPGFSAYGASKAGVVRLVETLAEELRPHVQVHAIAPGLVDTPLLDDVLAAGPLAGEDYERVLRVRAGEEQAAPAGLAAELAVFLASKASPSLTGRLISAPHDAWREWTEDTIPNEGLYTLRRLDEHTIRPLMASLP